MRDMLLVGAFGMPYGTIVGISGPIFAGLLLTFGIDKAAFGLILSVAQITGLIQLASFRLTTTVHPRALILGVGTLEILFTISVVTIPFWAPPEWRFAAVIALVGLGYACAHTHVPTFNSWFASVIPPETRGSYISRRTFVQYVLGIVLSPLIGRFIDMVPGMKGFGILYAVALVTGLMVYFSLARTPLPELGAPAVESAAEEGHFTRLFRPLRDAAFRRFLTFNLLWTLVAAIPGPYFNVFMIDALHLSYQTIMIFTSAQMVVMGLGFRMWGVVVDRFGGKPMIQLLFIPAALMPALWAFASPGFWVTVPVAMLVGGMMWSGLSIANSIMLYAIIPQQGEKSSYFAIWSASLGIVNAVAPAIGSVIMSLFADVKLHAAGFTFDSYHILFALTTVAYLIPITQVRRLPQLGSKTPEFVLSQLRQGNPFVLAFNTYLLGRTNEPERRATVLRSLGRSRSPLVTRQLVEALDDPSQEVRASAALALGDAGHVDAVDPLLAHLADPESDIRPEAALALGEIGSDRAVPLLVEALGDADTELRVAAAEALGSIGDQAARDALVAKLAGAHDHALVPTIAEALSRPIDREADDGERTGDLRMVRLVAAALPAYRSRPIRAQLLNALVRCLGVGERYARLVNANPYDRDASLLKLVAGARERVLAIRWPTGTSLVVATTFERLAAAQRDGRPAEFFDMVARLVAVLREHLAGRCPVLVDEGCAMLTALERNGQLDAMGEDGIIFALLVFDRMLVAAHDAGAAG